MGLAQDVIDPHGVKVNAIQDLRLVTLYIEVEQVDVLQPVLGEDISQHHASGLGHILSVSANRLMQGTRRIDAAHTTEPL